MGLQQPIDRLEAANDIFSEALELPPEARETFVRSRCPSDPDLAESVLRLLSRADQLGSFLERGPVFRARESEFRAGDVLAGRFRILGAARKGGMGAVYQAEDTALREVIALKTVHPGLRTDSEALARFRDEIRLARRIVHPNVCRIYDLFTDTVASGEMVFFTMEWLEGETLADRIAGGPMPLEDVLRVAAAIADGLDAAHRIGIVHRDLKPSNVILAPAAGNERVVITDFGLAKIFHAETENGGNTIAGEIMGSPDYMAPEQFLGEPASAATDVFALGIVVYEMLAGKKPYPSETLLRTALRRINERPTPVRRHRADIPEAWERAITKALSREPLERPQSATMFVAELGQRSAIADHIRLPSRRTLIKGGVAVSSLAAFFGYERLREWETKIPSKPIVMLTATTYSANEKDLEVAARATDVLLASQLNQSAHLMIVGQDEIERAWRLIGGKRESSGAPRTFEPETARHIALRTQAQFVTFANLAQIGDESVLRIRLEWLGDSSAHPRKAWARDFVMQGRQDVADSVFDAASWIRRISGESAASMEGKMRRPEELTTSSWEALKEFTAANEAWRHGQVGPAILHLKAALAIDDQFAMASARLADIYMANVQQDDAYREWARAVSLLEKKNFTDRESLRTRGIFALDVGLNETAIEVFSRYILEYQDDPLPRFYKAGALNRLGHTEEALELYSEAIRLAPDNYAFVMNRAICYLDAGRLQEAEADWRRGARLNGRDWTDQFAMALAFARADIGEVWRRIAQMRNTGSSEFQSKSHALEGCLRAEQGRLADAEGALLNGIEFDRRTGASLNARQTKQRLLAEVYIARGKIAEARCLCAEILNDKPGYQTRLHTGCVLARCGDVAEARMQQCADARQNLPALCGAGGKRGVDAGRGTACEPLKLPDWPIYNHWLHRLSSEIALAEGQLKQAADEIQAAPPPPTIHLFPDQLLRAGVAARNTVLQARVAGLVKLSPGRWWFEPEFNTAGFFSFAVRELGELSQVSQVSAIMAKLRA